MIDAGFEGAPQLIVVVRGAETCPQMVVLVTDILPPIKPALNVTLMQFVVDEPVVLGGNVHA